VLGIANQTERSIAAAREIVEGLNNLSQLLVQKFDALQHEGALTAGWPEEAVLGIANQMDRSFLSTPDLDKFILVYTMGKVGSTALVLSLKDINLFARHLQWLTPEAQAFFDKRASPNDVQHCLNRFNVNRCRYALKDTEFASLIKVITVIRSPIEQVLSHYFHAIDHFGNYLRTMHGQEVTCSTVSKNILDCVKFYLDNPGLELPELTEMLSDANWDRVFFYFLVFNYLNWIDREFKPFFPHINIPNGFIDGYAIAGNALILKFEELSPRGEQAVAAYVQRPHFKLARENVGIDKNLGELYQQLLNTIRFPKAFVDGLCDSKYVAQFYTQDERRDMKSRWTKH
jgi:hypothetical protein